MPDSTKAIICSLYHFIPEKKLICCIAVCKNVINYRKSKILYFIVQTFSLWSLCGQDLSCFVCVCVGCCTCSNVISNILVTTLLGCKLYNVIQIRQLQEKIIRQGS